MRSSWASGIGQGTMADLIVVLGIVAALLGIAVGFEYWGRKKDFFS